MNSVKLCKQNNSVIRHASQADLVPIGKAWEDLMLQMAVEDHKCVPSGRHYSGLLSTRTAAIP